MAIADLFGVVGGRPEIDSTAAERGFNLGAKAGELSSQTGPAAFFNQILQARDQRKLTDSKIQQEQTKARASKVQEILIKASDPNASQVDIAAAKRITSLIQENPDFAQAVGIDPTKTSPASITDSLTQIKALQDSGMFQPGSTIGVDTPFGKINTPITRELTEGEANTVAGAQSLEEVLKDINKGLDSGVFSKDSIERTIQQKVADSTNPLWSSLSPELQGFQQSLNTLKKTLPFTEGGKQLTPFEAARVFALLDVTGKGNDQIKKDINQALDIVRRKGSLILGGAPNTKAQTASSQTSVATSSGKKFIVEPA